MYPQWMLGALAFGTGFEHIVENFFGNRREAAQAYWRRAWQLEVELLQLDRWLSAEKRLRDSLDGGGGGGDRVDGVRLESLVEEELVRLMDGSYLRRMKRLGWPLKGQLTMQVSSPAVAENGSTASQVLNFMATLGEVRLRRSLLQQMPMEDMSKCAVANLERGKPVFLGSERGFMESIITGAVERLEELALEGLMIQSCKEEKEIKAAMEETKSCDDFVVVVMLIQMRDPKKGYEAVGDLMIALVEATPDAEGAAKRVRIGGVHLAGLKCVAGARDGEGFIWSVSMRGSSGHPVRSSNIGFH
ncbi:hypothetical protein QJS10_CPB18g00201 [Acorus calamus]|uniref:Uncharacterized protein n=1 Tax=Acorus calamus TaxID=4465 RepID=A0AAV9CK14_ACOCL|nr:hypothetical protein QJS10_CPB18g00201 [Acorus calamus]